MVAWRRRSGRAESWRLARLTDRRRSAGNRDADRSDQTAQTDWTGGRPDWPGGRETVTDRLLVSDHWSSQSGVDNRIISGQNHTPQLDYCERSTTESH